MSMDRSKRPVIIGFGGGAGHGKDTAATFVEDSPLFRGRSIHRFEFAEPLKRISGIVFGFTWEDMYTEKGKNRYVPEYDMTVRTILQKVGTDMFRDMIHPDIWLHCLRRKIEAVQEREKDPVFIITDARFPNESEYLRSLGNALILKVVRPDKTIVESGHASEKGDISEDAIIYNDGTLVDLKKAVETTLQEHSRGFDL